MSCNDGDTNSDSEYHDTYKDNLTTNHEISVTFHVHMPENLDKSIHPLVVGNIKELGNWTRPVVELYQIELNSTYWVLDPVKIYVRGELPQYKYAVYRPQKPQ
ncbi:e3 ubiquitin-protein ligase [Gigaspora margarita]|uniref:E3 ubiquitin-protein ligase n=1 Tax=Gigaspora margarita TaxID=4874 RepID=A0A8H4EUN8_GIGMA|nr:e3 ubiquitin-protein ligase [Gigaspora margarita]